MKADKTSVFIPLYPCASVVKTNFSPSINCEFALIGEILFNIAPVLESAGMNLQLPKGGYKEIKLLNFTDLGGGVVRIHNRIER